MDNNNRWLKKAEIVYKSIDNKILLYTLLQQLTQSQKNPQFNTSMHFIWLKTAHVTGSQKTLFGSDC